MLPYKSMCYFLVGRKGSLGFQLYLAPFIPTAAYIFKKHMKQEWIQWGTYLVLTYYEVE